MDALTVGRRVKIPVFLLGAPFPDQVLAMIRFGGKDVSGVLARSEVVDVREQTGFVRGKVLEVDGERMTLAVPKGLSAGTFSRSGQAVLPVDWARDNLRPDTDPA